MAVSWTIATIAMLLVLALLARVAVLRRDDALPAWHIAFNGERGPHGPSAVLEASMDDELESLFDTLELARSKHERGDVDNARSVMRAAAEHATSLGPSLLEKLRLWWATALAVAALYPLPRLRVWHFACWRLRSVAVGETALRPWLSRMLRFGLRVWVLVYGIGFVVGAFRDVLRDLRTDCADSGFALRRMQSLGADLGTLQSASLDVYKALLISLHQQATTGAPPHP